MSASRNFYRKQFSDYLGENRAILDIKSEFFPGVTPTPTPSPTPLPVFDTNYQAVLNRANSLGFSLPCFYEQVKQNNLIINLKNAGLWTKLSQFLMFKVDTSCASPGFTLINWITPSNSLSQLQRVSISDTFPVHTNNSGWTFNRQNRIQLGQNVQVNPNAIEITVSGNSEGLYMTQFITGSTSGENWIWASSNNEWNRAQYNNTTQQLFFRGNALTSSFDFTGLGFKAITIDGRPDTDTTVVFRNGGVSTDRTKTAVDSSIAGNELFLNSNSGPAGVGKNFEWTCGMWFNAGGETGNGFFSSTDVPALETIINAYMTS
jgi:hypothetical protein